MAVAPHVHISAVPIAANVVATVAVLGTLHLLALSSESRWGRALIALGF